VGKTDPHRAGRRRRSVGCCAREPAKRPGQACAKGWPTMALTCIFALALNPKGQNPAAAASDGKCGCMPASSRKRHRGAPKRAGREILGSGERGVFHAAMRGLGPAWPVDGGWGAAAPWILLSYLIRHDWSPQTTVWGCLHEIPRWQRAKVVTPAADDARSGAGQRPRAPCDCRRKFGLAPARRWVTAAVFYYCSIRVDEQRRNTPRQVVWKMLQRVVHLFTIIVMRSPRRC